MEKIVITAITIAVLGFGIPPARAEVSAAGIFKKQCAMCHRLNRRKVGPAFIHMSTDPKVLKTIITNGGNIMPRFGGKLSAAEIDAMVSYIRSMHTK